jgi:hypothetical protein
VAAELPERGGAEECDQRSGDGDREQLDDAGDAGRGPVITTRRSTLVTRD